MELSIELNGRVRRVAIERVGERYRVADADGSCWVETSPVDDRTVSLIVDGDRRESHEVGYLEGREPGDLEIYLRTGVIQARIESLSRSRLRRRVSGETASKAGEARVTTPMPGRVVKVLVSPGDHVEARQGLVVIEAMKMQNELKSPKAGLVTSILVSVGASVEAGRVVAVVE